MSHAGSSGPDDHGDLYDDFSPGENDRLSRQREEEEYRETVRQCADEDRAAERARREQLTSGPLRDLYEAQASLASFAEQAATLFPRTADPPLEETHGSRPAAPHFAALWESSNQGTCRPSLQALSPSGPPGLPAVQQGICPASAEGHILSLPGLQRFPEPLQGHTASGPSQPGTVSSSDEELLMTQRPPPHFVAVQAGCSVPFQGALTYFHAVASRAHGPRSSWVTPSLAITLENAWCDQDDLLAVSWTNRGARACIARHIPVEPLDHVPATPAEPPRVARVVRYPAASDSWVPEPLTPRASQEPQPELSPTLEHEVRALAQHHLEPADLPELTVDELQRVLGQPPSQLLLRTRALAAQRADAFRRSEWSATHWRVILGTPRPPTRQCPRVKGPKAAPALFLDGVPLTDKEKKLRSLHSSNILAIMSSAGDSCIWHEEMASHPAWSEAWQYNICQRYEHQGLRFVVSNWTRWKTWLTQVPWPSQLQPERPPAFILHGFMRDLRVRGPTAASASWKALQWLYNHGGLRELPLEHPLVRPFKEAAASHSIQQAHELPFQAFQALSQWAVDLDTPRGVFAGLTLLLMTSSLRFAHAQRAVIDWDSSHPNCLTAVISRGKSGVRLAYKVAVPGFLAPGQPTFWLLADKLRNLNVASRQRPWLFPAFASDARGAPAALLVDRPMSYSHFQILLRNLLSEVLDTATVLQVSTYSLRRKLPSVADRIGLAWEEREALGSWQSSNSASRQRGMPMAVRYSAARLQSECNARKVCLAALWRVTPSKTDSASSSEHGLTLLNAVLPDLRAEVLQDQWTMLPGNPILIEPSQPTQPEMGTQPVESHTAEPTPGASQADSPSGESDSSSSDGSAPSSASATDSPDESGNWQWLLPAGKGTRLHLLSPNAEPGVALACCRRFPFRWGVQFGAGLSAAAATGRSWSPRCKSKLPDGRNGSE